MFALVFTNILRITGELGPIFGLVKAHGNEIRSNPVRGAQIKGEPGGWARETGGEHRASRLAAVGFAGMQPIDSAPARKPSPIGLTGNVSLS